MQDFHSTPNRTLNLLNVTPYNRNNSRIISPSDKSHTITQISRCIFVVQSRIDELSKIVGGFGYKSRGGCWKWSRVLWRMCGRILGEGWLVRERCEVCLIFLLLFLVFGGESINERNALQRIGFLPLFFFGYEQIKT